jgi:hypothetical protein
VIKVIFACGHEQATDGVKTPTCASCGETRIERVQAPRPTIKILTE